MRILTILISLAICAAAGAASQRDVQKAANDDQLLANAGIEPAAAELRLPCAAAVLDTDDAPSAFNAVCVQTRHELNFFSLEDGYLMSELQLTLSNMDGVALQRLGRYSQVQIFSGRRVAAFSMRNSDWYDEAKTQAAYQWLIDHGVAQRQPRGWIGR